MKRTVKTRVLARCSVSRARETVIKDFQNFPAVAIFDFESKERLGKERSNWGRRRVKKNTPFFSYFFSLFRLIRRVESGAK